MKQSSFAMAFTAVAILLTGCSTTGGSNQTAGTLIGGVAGALVGSQFGGGTGRVVGAAVGTLGGALVGAEVGKSMDRQNQQRYTPPPPQPAYYAPA